MSSPESTDGPGTVEASDIACTPNARVVGEVFYRAGDGPNALIPLGPIEIEKGANDVTISWEVGTLRRTAALPMADYQLYRRKGAITDLASVSASASNGR
jgi:hypothetical protein